MEREIKIAEVYCHVKSGKLYWVENVAPIKHEGGWEKCVIYSPLVEDGHSTTYVRFADDFLKKFIITNCSVVMEERVKIAGGQS